MLDDGAKYYWNPAIDVQNDDVVEISRPYFRIKRVMDITLAVLIAPAAIVIIGAVAPFVLLDGGKCLLRQRRVGRDGKVFDLWKIRTMQPNAEALLAKHLEGDPAARQEWTSAQKLKHDPRITRIGSYLRKYSVDELPQIFNVLRGDMSLVGPRPMLPEQIAHYPGRAYFKLRPGLTGLWQIGERNGCSFAQRADYDDRYLAGMSLALDVRILLMTAIVVVRGTGI